MLHTCVQRFDVTGNLKNLAKFLACKRCLIWVGEDAKGACAVGCLATARKEGANLSG
jgi:hypothetical protein